jgi:hypothetical protein
MASLSDSLKPGASSSIRWISHSYWWSERRAVIPRLSRSSGLVEGKLAVSLVIAGAFALTVAAIALAVNRRMAWGIAGAVALFLGVIAAIYEIQK